MKLQINDAFFISDIADSDKPAYLEYLQEKQIYDQTLAIPYPYTEADADWWINHNLEATATQNGQSVNWAIRRRDGKLIGGIGFLGLKIGQDFKSELGYWLAKPYWGQGVMTEAVKKVTDYAFKEFGLVRITANVFDFNIGSARVLEKAGFQCEGFMRSHYKKDGKIFDGKLYALIAYDRNASQILPVQTKKSKLPEGYEIRELSEEEFRPLWNEYAPKVFDDNSQIFRVFDFLSEEERSKAKDLQAFLSRQYQLRLGVFHHGMFAGWCAGQQESAETYYMRNSAILPNHRRQGLYSALLQTTIEKLTEKGFQKIYSRHSATNNEVILPKLKAGFTISALEVSDMFGVLVHLTYFPKYLRRKIMIYRVGDAKPDGEVRKCLKI